MGHKYQIDEVRRLFGDAAIVSLMSPNFVQRGEPALFDKYARGKCAALNGVDLALSFPLVFALLSAEGFAEGGVRLAKLLGATHLAFGVETNDEALVHEVAELLISKEFDSLLQKEIEDSPSLSFPTHRERAVVKALSKTAGELIKKPNNILAVEYVKAIKRFAPEIKPIMIKRCGNDYNDTSANGDLLSASAIRELYRRGENYLSFLPEETARVLSSSSPFDYEKFESLLYSVVVTKDFGEIERSVGSFELASIIKKSAESYPDYKSFRASLSRKKYPETKIDRALISLLLDISYDEYLHTEPQYVTLLASNEKGKKIISAKRKEVSPLIFSKAADIKDASDLSAKAEIFGDRIYAMCMKKPEEGAYFLKKKPYIKED